MVVVVAVVIVVVVTIIVVVVVVVVFIIGVIYCKMPCCIALHLHYMWRFRCHGQRLNKASATWRMQRRLLMMITIITTTTSVVVVVIIIATCSSFLFFFIELSRAFRLICLNQNFFFDESIWPLEHQLRSSVCPFLCRSVCLSVLLYLCLCRSVCLPVCVSLFMSPSVCLFL